MKDRPRTPRGSSPQKRSDKPQDSNGDDTPLKRPKTGSKRTTQAQRPVQNLPQTPTSRSQSDNNKRGDPDYSKDSLEDSSDNGGDNGASDSGLDTDHGTTEQRTRAMLADDRPAKPLLETRNLPTGPGQGKTHPAEPRETLSTPASARLLPPLSTSQRTTRRSSKELESPSVTRSANKNQIDLTDQAGQSSPSLQLKNPTAKTGEGLGRRFERHTTSAEAQPTAAFHLTIIREGPPRGERHQEYGPLTRSLPAGKIAIP